MLRSGSSLLEAVPIGGFAFVCSPNWQWLSGWLRRAGHAACAGGRHAARADSGSAPACGPRRGRPAFGSGMRPAPGPALQRACAFLPHCLDSPAKFARSERAAAHPSSGGSRSRRSEPCGISSDYVRRTPQQDCRDNVAESGVSAATGAPPRRHRRASEVCRRVRLAGAGGTRLAATSSRRLFPPWAKTLRMETLLFP